MAKTGYARVSTRGQNTDSQLDELAACGCDKIWGAGSNGPVSTARASSFLNAAGTMDG